MNKPPIVETVRQRVELRRIGNEFVGLCPFHSERTPSFTVSEDKGVFYCHGCHEGGDVYSFVQKLDRLTFPEALRALGVEFYRRPTPKLTASRMHAADRAVTWGERSTQEIQR